MRWFEERRKKKNRQEWEAAANPEHKFHEAYVIAKQIADENERMACFQRMKRLWMM